MPDQIITVSCLPLSLRACRVPLLFSALLSAAQPRTLSWAADEQDAQQPLAAAAAAAAAERNGGDTEDEDEEEDPMPFGRTASQRRPGTITVTEGPSAQPQMAALRR